MTSPAALGAAIFTSSSSTPGANKANAPTPAADVPCERRDGELARHRVGGLFTLRGRCRGGGCFAGLQELACFFVGGLGEVFVPEADCVEGLGRFCAEHFVDVGAEVIAGRR